MQSRIMHSVNVCCWHQILVSETGFVDCPSHSEVMKTRNQKGFLVKGRRVAESIFDIYTSIYIYIFAILRWSQRISYKKWMLSCHFLPGDDHMRLVEWKCMAIPSSTSLSSWNSNDFNSFHSTIHWTSCLFLSIQNEGSLTFDWGEAQASNDFPTAILQFPCDIVLKWNGCIMWDRWRFPPWPLWRTCLSLSATAATNVTRSSRVQVSLWRKWWRGIYPSTMQRGGVCWWYRLYG